MSTSISRRAVLLAVPGAIVLAGAASAGLFSSPVPDDLDLSLTRLSKGGLYRARAFARGHADHCQTDACLDRDVADGAQVRRSPRQR